MGYRKRKYRRKNKFTVKAVRSIVAIVVLSALVLGVSFFVREVATLDGKKFARVTNPLFSRIGISEYTVGEVAGDFIERLSDTDIGSFDAEVYSAEQVSKELSVTRAEKVFTKYVSDTPVLEVAIMADSEDDFDNFDKALSLVTERGISTVIFLGDFSRWGTEESLLSAKEIF